MGAVTSDPRRLVFTVVIVGIVLSSLIFWSRLPDPIATKWAGTDPSGSLVKWLWLVLMPILWCIKWGDRSR